MRATVRVHGALWQVKGAPSGTQQKSHKPRKPQAPRKQSRLRCVGMRCPTPRAASRGSSSCRWRKVSGR